MGSTVNCKKSEVGSRKWEDKSHKSEVRSQKAEDERFVHLVFQFIQSLKQLESRIRISSIQHQNSQILFPVNYLFKCCMLSAMNCLIFRYKFLT
jgi:hypothetical protein